MIRRWFKSLGPGLITAALVFGPGSLTITSKLGAVYGYNLLWVIIVAALLMLTFTGMGARIGLASDQSLISLFRKKWGNAAALIAGISIFFVTAAFQAGNTVGAGLALSESLGQTNGLWIVVISLMAISLMFFKSFYKILEKVMMIMVGIMLISFLFTLIIAPPVWSEVMAGLNPSIPQGSFILVIALVASSFSIAGAFYQSYLVQEKGWEKGEAKDALRESYTGIVILGLISSMIMISAATILYPKGVTVTSAGDIGMALEPVYGKFSFMVFMIGLFGASFSSLLGNASIGGTLLSDALSLGRNLNGTPVKILITLIIIIGASIALIFGRLPLELIVFAQGITIFAVPFIGLGLFLIGNDTNIMGSLKNNTFTNIIGVIGLLVLFTLALSNAYSLFNA
ncbi:Nramp family divalent metal transporter [Cyclobacterium marinum]|uniref:Natural resistance-associated macrophage protein n=1 Tax=Cyclobacterium marinum (strain ATCC 25205 / DSM 745 / LMG 13164 / NCIMB 1802) TaxID=880070 RepID=G0IV83_CYCMS|nr:Nramp family divalent metal transporter [Cyclobacterium marinum]AEL27074.1 natural resistance-associated macrophage protein [Cyclobacterium marinum DSM 745]MBR9775473.1 divalent metal cation transporter [Cytophagales bacterium]|tara:strand:+ start:75259 stop:76455 length:1197 start_codon:yes stop_codon:yes gene_type:complete